MFLLYSYRCSSLLLLMLLAVASLLKAQNSTSSPPEPPPIQDNSFLVEEAYNQENGVVQHIQTFTRMSQSHSWVYTFTQEFPVGGVKNQLSYTLQAGHNGGFPGSGAGLGDFAINYRYQLVGDGESRVAVSPRISLIAPAGAETAGMGLGGTGVQIQLPVSVELTKHLVSHSNVGTTLTPRARNEFGNESATYSYNLGQSLIWLVRPRFNALLETVWVGTERVVAPGQTQRGHDLLISPGVRWAYNFKNGLQIVPGIGVPIGVGPSSGEKGILLYLSFEHPWKAFRK